MLGGGEIVEEALGRQMTSEADFGQFVQDKTYNHHGLSTAVIDADDGCIAVSDNEC